MQRGLCGCAAPCVSTSKHFAPERKILPQGGFTPPEEAGKAGPPFWRMRQMGRLHRIEGELKQKLLELRG